MTHFSPTNTMRKKACFMPFCVTPTGGGMYSNIADGKRLNSCLFPILPPHLKVLRKKATYYVREGKVLQVALSLSLHSSPKPHSTFRSLASMDRITITLPYPPTVNHYWKSRVVRKGTRFVPSVYVSDVGQEYQRTVVRVLDGIPRFTGPLRVQILVQPPDGRQRDLDNILKCLLDSLTKAGVWSDDSQVSSLLVVRGDQVNGGAVIVMVEELEG